MKIIPFILQFVEPFNRKLLEVGEKEGYYDENDKVWRLPNGEVMIRTSAEKSILYGCTGTLADREW